MKDNLTLADLQVNIFQQIPRMISEMEDRDNISAAVELNTVNTYNPSFLPFN